MDTGQLRKSMKDYGTNIIHQQCSKFLCHAKLYCVFFFVKKQGFPYWIIIIINQQRFSSHCSNIHPNILQDLGSYRGTGKAKKRSGTTDLPIRLYQHKWYVYSYVHRYVQMIANVSILLYSIYICVCSMLCIHIYICVCVGIAAHNFSNHKDDTNLLGHRQQRHSSSLMTNLSLHLLKSHQTKNRNSNKWIPHIVD